MSSPIPGGKAGDDDRQKNWKESSEEHGASCVRMDQWCLLYIRVELGGGEQWNIGLFLCKRREGKELRLVNSGVEFK